MAGPDTKSVNVAMLRIQIMETEVKVLVITYKMAVLVAVMETLEPVVRVRDQVVKDGTVESRQSAVDRPPGRPCIPVP